MTAAPKSPEIKTVSSSVVGISFIEFKLYSNANRLPCYIFEMNNFIIIIAII